MSQRTFLELTHNPFAPPREGFYSGADRKSHLEHVRHLNQWSRRVLLVTGPFGIGKSTLFKELSSNLPVDTKGARISGSMVTGEREVLLAVVQGLGVSCDQEAHMEDIVALVLGHVEAESQRERMCVVMIDDAHLLAHTAAALLMRLVGQSSLRVVMFAEPSLVASINQSAKKYEVEWYEIRLSGFPAQDVRSYLEWRFAQAQYRGRLPFTEAQVSKIAERSGGNPNVIDFMANELLADLETGEVRHLGGRFPRKHAVLVGVLGILVFLVYQLYLQQPLDGTDVFVEAQVYRAADAGSGQAEPADPADVEDQEDSTTTATSQEGQVIERVGAVVESTLVEVSDDADAGAESAISDTPFDEDNSVANTDVEVEAINTPPEQETALPQQETEPDPVVETEAPDLADEQIAEPQPEPTRAEPRIPVREASTDLDALDIPAGIKGPRWLGSQNPSHYTLQLMTLSRRTGGVDLIKRQSDADEFAMYPLRREDKMLYVVTYGVFSTQDAAQRAAASLTGELAGFKPWIRRFANVQDAIAN